MLLVFGYFGVYFSPRLEQCLCPLVLGGSPMLVALLTIACVGVVGVIAYMFYVTPDPHNHQ
jgi:hypothetical protein